MHHRRGLRRLLRDDALATAVEYDWRTAGLSRRREVMLHYTEKLTLTPWEVSRADVETLREVGFDDRDILDIAEVVAYYAYVNRIADGLGVEVEPWTEPS